MSEYRLSFEVVIPIGKGAKYYDATLKHPIVSPDAVNEEDWAKTTHDTDNPWDQFNTLKKWEKDEEHLIRNVKLYKISEKITDITDNHQMNPK